MLKYLSHLGHFTMPWSFLWWVLSSLTVLKMAAHNLHLIFRALETGSTDSLGLVVPSVSTCNVDSLFIVMSCKTSSAFGASSLLECGHFLDCLACTGLVTNLFALSINA